MLVEHYGLGILVCHLGHVTEDIFFCNNTKEAPTKRGTERGREIYHVHFWQVRRELSSFSVAKFCRKVPNWDFCTTLFSEMAWIGRSDPELNLCSNFWWPLTSVLATDRCQSLVWRRAESVEDYAVLLRAGNATLFLWADSTYTVRSKCCETEVKQSEWTPPSHPHTLALVNKKVKLIFQHKFKSIFKGCTDIAHY